MLYFIILLIKKTEQKPQHYCFQVLIKIETEIEKLRIVVRSDRQMNKDVGIKKKLLLLFLNYNPLWLVASFLNICLTILWDFSLTIFTTPIPSSKLDFYKWQLLTVISVVQIQTVHFKKVQFDSMCKYSYTLVN